MRTLSPRWRLWLTLATCGVVVVSAAAFVVRSTETSQVGPVASVESSLRVEHVPPTTAAGVGDAGRDRGIAPNPIGRLDELASTPQASPPIRVRIDRLGVDAPIVPQGVDPRTGQMEIPRNVRDVAWYRHGPVPGEAGSAVLAAHVDLTGRGPGVFFGLRELAPGHVVIVTHENGDIGHYTVVGRAVYRKEELPLESIFSARGPSVLTLITCGGRFDRAARRYDSNVVVYAVPTFAGGPEVAG